MLFKTICHLTLRIYYLKYSMSSKMTNISQNLMKDKKKGIKRK